MPYTLLTENLSQNTGFGSLFYYPLAPNASEGFQGVSTSLFNTLQAEAEFLGVHKVFKHNLTAELISIHRNMMRTWFLHLQVLLPHPQPQPAESNTNTLLKLRHSLYGGSLG